MSANLGKEISELFTRYEALQRAVSEQPNSGTIRKRASEIFKEMQAQMDQLSENLRGILSGK